MHLFFSFSCDSLGPAHQDCECEYAGPVQTFRKQLMNMGTLLWLRAHDWLRFRASHSICRSCFLGLLAQVLKFRC